MFWRSSRATDFRKGYTLVELIAAIGVIAILALPLLRIMGTTYSQSLRSVILNEATYVASGVLDYARNNLYQQHESYDLASQTVFSGTTADASLSRSEYNIPEEYETVLTITKALASENDLYRLAVQVTRGSVAIEMETLVYME